MNPSRLHDLICFSHLRWDFVWQRPQHLMARWAQRARVFYVEEPIFGDCPARFERSSKEAGMLVVLVPHLPRGLSPADVVAAQAKLLESLLETEGVEDYVLWFYTPMAMPLASSLKPIAVVYDCMDELSAFQGAPPELVVRESALLNIADVVTTGGDTLYRAKRKLHHNVHAFRSSVDTAHFARARSLLLDPADQRDIPRIRLGFCGVIDERMDLVLLADLAAARPDWHIVLLGPIVKIDPGTLPRALNLHYLGPKQYEMLPDYFAGWDVAILPFARNESTRFISPTKIPEYLAAGRPVVSTSIADVIEPYGRLGLAHIADESFDFVAAVERALAEDPVARRAAVDAFLADKSWDITFHRMSRLVMDAAEGRALLAETATMASAATRDAGRTRISTRATAR